MSLQLQIIILTILVIRFVVFIAKIRDGGLDLKYSLAWGALIIGLAILTAFPELLGFFSHILGFSDPMNMLFVCGFFLSIIIIYTLTRAVSKLMNEVRRLTQRIAILEDEIKR
mgnify:CR=1 FL=1